MDIADINNDGGNDIVFCLSDSLAVMKQNTAGGFLSPEKFYSGSLASGCKAADVNNDGLADVVVSHGGVNGSFIRVFLQASGGFTSTSYIAATASGAQEIEIGDVNGDGRNDVAVMRGTGGAGQLYVYTQTPFGTLNNYAYYPAPTTNTWNLRGIEIADVNTDGLGDVIATRGSFASYSLVTWLQDPVTHLLQTPTELSLAPAVAFPIEAAYLNCDGSPDILTAGSITGGLLTVLTNDSNDGYSVNTSFLINNQSGLQPQALSIGDFNGDGMKDVAIADFNHGVHLLKNTTPGGPSGTQYIITPDTLSTVISTQDYFYNTVSNYNSNGYAVTRTDSFKVHAVARRDSIRIDSVIIHNVYCSLHPDTFYTTHTFISSSVVRDTTLLGTRYDSLSLHVGEAVPRPDVQVYPNPGAGLITIKSAGSIEKVELYAYTGQRIGAVLQQKPDGCEADFRAHPAGVYLLRIGMKGGETKTIRVLKQ